MTTFSQITSYASQAGRYVCRKTDQFLTQHPHLRNKLSKHGAWVAVASGIGFLSSQSIMSLAFTGLFAFAHYRARSLQGRIDEINKLPIRFRKFPQLCESHTPVASHVLSLLTYAELCKVSATCRRTLALRNANNYRLDRQHVAHLEKQGRVLDAKLYAEWQVERIANITNEGIRRFLNCYYGENDLFGRPGKVGNYCPPAVVQAKQVRDIGSDGAWEDFTPDKLGEITKRSKEHPARYWDDQTDALVRHGKYSAGNASIVLQMDRVVGRGQPRPRRVQTLQRLPPGWRSVPNCFSQILWTFAQYAVNGVRYFGNRSGQEGDWSFGDTDASVEIEGKTYSTYTGGFNEGEGPAPAWLYVHDSHLDNAYFVAGVQRKFY